MDQYQVDNLLETDTKGSIRMSTKQLKSLEITLAGALRREQMAETSIKQLQAEVEQLNRLVRQREEDTRCTKMMLRFREDKIQRMEALVHGSIPTDTYLLKENKSLSEEVQLLQAKVDRNPEVTRFALENIRLLEQLRRFQDFYEEGEREILLSEVSKLRDQLLQFIDGNKQQDSPVLNVQPQEAFQIGRGNDCVQLELKSALDDLEDCRCNLRSCLEENAKLSREIDDLHTMLTNLKSASHDQDDIADIKEGSLSNGHVILANVEIEGKHEPMLMKHAEEIMNLQLELDILKIILSEERSSRGEIEDRVMHLNRDLDLERQKLLLMSKKYDDQSIDLKEAKSVIEVLESQQLWSIDEIEELRNKNSHYVKLLRKHELETISLKEQLVVSKIRDHSFLCQPESEDSPLRTKLNRMQASLDMAKRLNLSFQTNRALQASNEEEMDEVRRQVEAETAEVIVCLQEELSILQQQVQDGHAKEMETKNNITLLETELLQVQENLGVMTEHNKRLTQNLVEKDGELRMLSEEWELLIREMEEVLADGQDALLDASDQIDQISSSFPHRRIWISEQVSNIVRIISEKELLIEDLSICLEDANIKRSNIECMLKSLRGAALAITEAHQQECSEKEKEILLLTADLNAKASTVAKLEVRLKLAEENIVKASKCATVAFVTVSTISEMNYTHCDALAHKDLMLKELDEVNLRKDTLLSNQAAVIEDANQQILSLREELAGLEGMCNSLRQTVSDEQKHASTMQQKLEAIEENSILKTQEKLGELKDGVSTLRSCLSKMHVEHEINLERINLQDGCRSVDCNDDKCTDTRGEKGNIDLHFGKGLKADVSEARRTCMDISRRDKTITLLKPEIESALESLKEVQTEMAILRDQKEMIQISENQSHESMRCLTNEVLNLQEVMGNFEKQCQLKIEAMYCKLHGLDQLFHKAGTRSCQTRELLELEVDEANIVAAEKSAEASYVLAKFGEAQDMMKEADVMINRLMMANETMRLDIEGLKNNEISFNEERNMLVNEVQNLQSINDVERKQFKIFEKQFGSDLMAMKDMIVELEGVISEGQTTFKENLISIALDFKCTKSLILDSTKLVGSWLEDIWSEIIVKDCAVSVLHLCHMGILLETVSGLNAEHGLLQHGLSESNSVIADLREHNFKSIKELELCRILKGKLLADIKTNFDRISHKEEESGELTVKISNFEKRVLDLQLQEEVMLQRSNDMGSQLAILTKELDLSNMTAATTLLDQEKLLKDKEALLNSQLESLMLDSLSKEFELLIFATKLEETSLQNADSERKRISCSATLENLKKEIILVEVDVELKDQFLADKNIEMARLQREFEEAQLGKLDLSTKLNENDLIITKMEEVNKSHEQNIQFLKEVVCSHDVLKNELDDVVVTKTRLLHQIQTLEAEHTKLLEVLKMKEIALEFSSSQVSSLQQENQKLQGDTNLLETSNSKLQNQLRDELKTNETNILNCVDLLEIAVNTGSKISNVVNDATLGSFKKMFSNAYEDIEKMTSNFMEEFKCLEDKAKDLISENLTLQAALSRKDEVLQGLLFDLSLLQESASNSKDQKDKIKEIETSLQTLEDELAVKSCDQDKAVVQNLILQAQLQEKLNIVSALELDLAKEHESLDLISSENLELRAQIGDALVAKSSFEEDLTEERKITNSLEMELSQMGNALGQMNNHIESLTSNLNELYSERDDLRVEILSLKDNLESTQTQVEVYKVNVMEAQQVAESRNIYAEEKEAEVKLLERSVEELECIVNALESKVDIVKGEAERQRLEREELELELDAVKHQMQNVQNADNDMKRYLDEREKNFQEALKYKQILEKKIADKDAEITKYKDHISELTLSAEAQACEYKQKFIELEAMAEQVRLDYPSSNISNSLSNKSEKNAAKPRGSGSPFKCIGLGLAQQMKSEKDEELAAARLRIEELESLLRSRQNEIFALNARLASTESMTHDVIRDLVGLKLDMTNYASLLDIQQIHKMKENMQTDSLDNQMKDKEVIKLKQQLNELVGERQLWLEEIDRKQAELVAVQISLEKLRQRDQLLKTENEMLKMENINHKTKVMELVAETKKLSGQQNLHQRIHHHAKIKEENNMLRLCNEDLSTKLQRAEDILSRAKEELAHYRTSAGRNPYLNFDEEQMLTSKLKQTEEERLQLAQNLLGLCTSILKAAGVTRPKADINPSIAEEALAQLKNRIYTLQRELQDLKFKNRIPSERTRLSELMPQSPPIRSRTDDSCKSPRRAVQAPFLSTLDR